MSGWLGHFFYYRFARPLLPTGFLRKLAQPIQVGRLLVGGSSLAPRGDQWKHHRAARDRDWEAFSEVGHALLARPPAHSASAQRRLANPNKLV